MMEGALGSSMHINSNFNSSKLKPPINLLQSLSIEKYRLDYLHKCKYRKRPPQSLRLSGCNAILSTHRVTLLSKFESEVLMHAIHNKKKQIKEVEEKIIRRNDGGNSMAPFNKTESNNWRRHFIKKLEFMKSQEQTKWKEWTNRSNNHKRKKQIKDTRRKNKIEKLAKYVLQQKQVINLTNLEIPPEAVVILSKGLGYVRTPTSNIEELRLDARHFTNKIAIESINNEQEAFVSDQTSFPRKLKQTNYKVIKPPNNNPTANTIVDTITKGVDSLKINKRTERKDNLSNLEIDGLRWLQTKTSSMEIIVDKADKGGAILIYPPALAEDKIKEKVMDRKLYDKLDKDPSIGIYNSLITLWTDGKRQKFVTEEEAIKVVGLTKNNKKSTTSIYKPGETYFNPSLKIHKMEVEDIKPGCNPPARLITCLQNGIMSRNDIFIANKWLKQLQSDFCSDIVQDSLEVLRWLEDLNNNYDSEVKKKFKPFTFDFASLYDSLTPTLVKEAIKYAIQKCRPSWNNTFINWLLELIELSMSAGFGKFKNKWYRPKTGIPTGGNICVELANIAVFYALYMCLFCDQSMMQNVVSAKRFIDDGTGIFTGNEEEFNNWKKQLVTKLQKFNLTIKDEDWDVAFKLGETVHILDITYGFDETGSLMTDLYRKPTDSRGYLHYSSCHPPHVFSSIVYSQALRLKRIINNEGKLNTHLEEMKSDFLNAKYPVKLVDNIITKVKATPRSLDKNTNRGKIEGTILTTTFGRGKPLKDIVKRSCAPFKKVVTCVNRTGSTLRSMLCNVKYVSTGHKYGISKPCCNLLCKACHIMSGESEIKDSKKKKKFKTASGSCRTQNCIYAGICKICDKKYVGKSTQQENRRISGHRDSLKKYVNNPEVVNNISDLSEKDQYTLATHLHDVHNIRTHTGLDDHYKVTILEICTPRSLDVKEHLWIQKLKTLTPFGLNLSSPLGFSMLI